MSPIQEHLRMLNNLVADLVILQPEVAPLAMPQNGQVASTSCPPTRTIVQAEQLLELAKRYVLASENPEMCIAIKEEAFFTGCRLLKRAIDVARLCPPAPAATPKPRHLYYRFMGLACNIVEHFWLLVEFVDQHPAAYEPPKLD